jgi:hypothetical protein
MVKTNSALKMLKKNFALSLDCAGACAIIEHYNLLQGKIELQLPKKTLLILGETSHRKT